MRGFPVKQRVRVDVHDFIFYNVEHKRMEVYQ